MSTLNSTHPYGIIALHNLMGLGAKDFKLRINMETASTLMDIGYQFNSEVDDYNWSELKRDGGQEYPEWAIESNSEVVKRFIQCGGWPFVDAKPRSIELAIKDATKKKSNQLERFFIMAQDPKASLAACSTDAQFSKVIEIIGREALDPFLADIPKSFRAKVFENDLGM